MDEVAPSSDFSIDSVWAFRDLPVAIVWQDDSGRILWANEPFARGVGRSLASISRQTPEQAGLPAWVVASLPPKYRLPARPESGTGRSVVADSTPAVADGADGVDARLRPRTRWLRDMTGEVCGTQTIFWELPGQAASKRGPREITAPPTTTADNRPQHPEGPPLNSQFLANMSHEIRTPLNAVIGMTELLWETPLNRTQMEYLRLVQDSGLSLLAIVNDVLDYAKMEAGKFHLDPSLTDVPALVNTLVKGLSHRAELKGLALSWRASSDFPAGVRLDPVRFQQIVSNLVTNAIKFTETGQVTVELNFESITEDRGFLRLTVQDTGIGIAPEYLEHIFEEDCQGDLSTPRKYGGRGLGLTITSQLVKLMDGEIAVQSELSQGSQFQVTVPVDVARVLPVSAVDTTSIQVHGVRILVVDDELTNRRLLRDMLANWGVSATTATQPAEALHVVEVARSQRTPFQVLLLDDRMGQSRGWELAKSVIDRGDFAPAAILVLTSGLSDEDLATYRTLGLRPPLLKPAKQSEIYNAIVNCLAVLAAHPLASVAASPQTEIPGFGQPPLPERPFTATTQGVQPDGASLEAAPRLAADEAAGGCEFVGPPSAGGRTRGGPMRGGPMRVLVAEDNKVNQKLAGGLLSRMGHQVVLVSNGREALHRLAQEPFDLVLMDVQMPDLDGYQATKMWREMEARGTGHVPILAMTARALRGDRERCLAAGMDDYLSKPIRSADLHAKLELLSQRLPCQKLEHSPAAVRTGQASEGLPAISPEVDWQRARKNTAQDAELLDELLGTFLTETPRLMSRMQQALDSRDVGQISAIAHALKGSLGFLATSTAHASCERIELHVQDWPAAEVEAQWQACQAKIQRVIDEVVTFKSSA